MKNQRQSTWQQSTMSLSLTLLLLIGLDANAQQTLLGYWNFNEGESGTPWNVPIAATAGAVDAQITGGTWIWGDGTYTDAFAGSSQNALFGDPAGASLSLRNHGMNGNYFHVEFTMEGFAQLEISYWTRRTATGFNNNQWAWSTDGENFTDFGPVINPTENTAGEVISLEAPSELDNSPTVYLRYTLDGATSAAGNNRIDNLQINAIESDPTQAATPFFSPQGGMYFEPQNVTIHTTTEGAYIHYTLNGTDPTENDHLFETPIEVTEDVTIKARAFKDGLEPSNVAEAEYLIRQLILAKDFEDEDLYSGGWTVYDVLEGANSWEIDDYDNITYAMITEYGSDPAYPHSWYISPGIDLSNAFEETLFSFYNQAAHRTGEAFSVNISTDYTGSGNPAEATWTTLDAELDPHTGGGFGTWTYSGDIDLSGYDDEVYVAFRYQSAPDNVGRWHINDILITGMEPTESSDARLATFTVGGICVLELGGLEVDDPATDPGATLYVDDFDGFEGIVVVPNHELADYNVTVNGEPISEEELDEHPVAPEDIIVVTVTAEDLSVKHYKVTTAEEVRTLVILTPEQDDEFFTHDEVTFSWSAENLDQLIFQVYSEDAGDAVYTETVDAGQEEIIMEVPNGVHGSYKYRLIDKNDPSFYAESAYFHVVDNVAPTLTEHYPEHEATDVETGLVMLLVFDENPIFPGEGSIHVHRLEDGQQVESVAADSDQVDISDETVAVSLNVSLDYETTYYVLIDNNAFVDIGDNQFEGIDDPEAWTFTTLEDDVTVGLICNGDFEDWTDGLPDCWYGEKSSIAQGNVNQYSDNPHTGSFAVQLIREDSGHQRFTSQHATLEDNHAYEITFWVKGQGEIRTGLFDDRDSGFGYAPYNSYIMVDSDSWSEHTQVVTAANSTDIAEFIFSVRNTSAARNHLQLDNISVEVISEGAEEVNNIAQLREGTVGAIYTITEEVILTFQQSYRNQKFIQDETAAIMIDDNSEIITTSYNRYDGITGITGTLGVYNQMLQFIPSEDPGPPSSGGNQIDPETRTLASLSSDDQAKLIRVENVTFQQTGTFATGTAYNISSPDGDGIFYTEFWDADYIEEPIPADPQSIHVIVTEDNNYIRVTARDLSDFLAYVNTMEILDGEAVIYPNPFRNNIHVTGNEQLQRALIINTTGQILMEIHTTERDLNIFAGHLVPGIYFIQLQFEDGTIVNKKLLKQ